MLKNRVEVRGLGRISRLAKGIGNIFVLRANEKRVSSLTARNPCLFCGPTWARTRDPLIMSQVL